MDEQNKASLSDFDTLNDWIGRIRAELSADIEGNRVILLVEGSRDKQLFARVFGVDNERIILFPMGGVKALRDLMQCLNDMKGRGVSYIDSVVAVRDRDYTNPASYPPHMFAYDHCAMELMLLYHPKIRSVLQGFHMLSERFPVDMLRRIAVFSLLRQDNYKHRNDDQWKINFDNPDILSSIQNKQRMPDMEELFRQYEKRHSVLQGQYDIYQKKADALSDSDLWEITNGHDICALLAAYVTFDSEDTPQDKRRRTQMDEKRYFNIMLRIYQPEYFQDTDLYRDSLSTYELPNRTRPFQFESVTTSTPA